MPPTPPADVRQDDEIAALRREIAALSTHLRQVSEELATERAAREKIEKKGISVLNLHVPFLMWFLTVGPLVSVGIVLTKFYAQANQHMANTMVHADEKAAIINDGLAYKKRVEEAIASMASDLRAEDRRLGRAVRAMKCGPAKAGAMLSCAYPDPNTLPLRE